MIDTHCHLDQLDAPETIANEAERRGAMIVAVTNLPSHYAQALQHLEGFQYVKPALGLHPLMVANHAVELTPFIRLARTADYIGEIGLDFSPKGVATKDIQVSQLDKMLNALTDRPRFITVHSRQAVLPLLEMLATKNICPVVFHWFTGTSNELERVISSGHYLSINPAMIGTKAGERVINETPIDRLLTETDAPYARTNNRATTPWDVGCVLDHLAKVWKKDRQEVDRMIAANFRGIMPK